MAKNLLPTTIPEVKLFIWRTLYRCVLTLESPTKTGTAKKIGG